MHIGILSFSPLANIHHAKKGNSWSDLLALSRRDLELETGTFYHVAITFPASSYSAHKSSVAQDLSLYQNRILKYF